MLIFWDERLVFLATPKAGSTAVETSLDSLAAVALERPAALKHTGIATYRRHVGPWLAQQAGERFTTVALMREPVDWLRSWYRFRMLDAEDAPHATQKPIDFAEFTRLYAAPDGPQSLGIGSQAEFLIDQEARVDRIFRYEDIDRFVEFLEQRLGCAIELPRINVPPSVDVRLDAEAEAGLRRALAADLALYNEL